jgi:hypothetical protein
MALLKLWNSLLGRSSENSSQPEQSSQPVLGTSESTPTADAASQPQQKTPAKKTLAKKTTSRRGLFGGNSPHAALLKRLRGVTADSVLEISVGDGSRAVEVLALLGENAAKLDKADVTGQKIRYAAIDQFEMGNPSEIGVRTHTLMQFHQTMRSGGIRPQVFPETIDRGLIRVAHTIGSIDLIVISAGAGSWQTPAIKALLSRITHNASLIVFQQDETWQTLSLSELGSEPIYRRAA